MFNLSFQDEQIRDGTAIFSSSLHKIDQMLMIFADDMKNDFYIALQ